MKTATVERIVVDDSGVKITKPRNNELRQWRKEASFKLSTFRTSSESKLLKYPNLKTLSAKVLKSPTPKDLERLEDAIFNHGNPDPKHNYRTQFLEICNPTKELIPNDFEDYLSDFPSNKRRALLYCWQIKKWRPDATGNRVLDGTLNKYIK